MDEGGVHLNHEDKLFLTITEVLDGLPWSKVIEFAITSIEQTTDEPYPIDPVRTAVDMRLLQVCAMHSTDPFSDDIRVLMERLREKLWHTPTFSSATREDDSEGEIDEMAVLVEEADIASIQRLLGGAPSEIPVQPSTRKQLPEKGLDEDELTRLLLAIEQSENPLEAVVGALLLDSGMRISELCSLNVTHIDYQDLCGLIDGDGPSTRLVFLSERVRPALNAWMEQRRLQFKGDEQDLLISLPPRLHSSSGLPWFNCWTQQLRNEKKSEHTIRAYTVAARTLSTTALPGEGNLDWDGAKTLSVLEFHSRVDPNRGRLDAWLNSMGELKSATVNVRLAAASHLLQWVGHSSIPDWIPRRSQLKGDDQALFIDADGKRLTTANADKLLESLADAAKIKRIRLTAHTLRHDFAYRLLEQGADLVSIQKLLGHSSFYTTRVYLEISDSDLREVYERAEQSSALLDERRHELKHVLDRVRSPEPMAVERQDDSDSPSEGVMLMTEEVRNRLLESLDLTEELIVEVLIPVPVVLPEQSEPHYQIEPRRGFISQISEKLSPKQIENILQIGSERPSAMASMESATASIEELISRQVYVGDRLVGTIVGERHHPDQGVDTMRLKVEPDVAEEYMRKPAEFAPLPKELIHSIKKDGSVKLSRSMRELQRRWRNACKISEQLYSPDELLGRAVIDNQGTEIGTVSALVKVKRTFRGLLVEVRTNVARSHGLGQTIRIPIPAISHSRSPNVLIISMTLDKLLTMPNYLQLNERRGDGSYFAWTDNPAVGDWEPSLEERVTSLVEHYSLRKKK